MKFTNVEITPETIIRTREHFAASCLKCTVSAVEYPPAGAPLALLPEGMFYVNRLAEYISREDEKAAAWLAGDYDGSFTFMQRAHYLQTGESVALLP